MPNPNTPVQRLPSLVIGVRTHGFGSLPVIQARRQNALPTTGTQSTADIASRWCSGGAIRRRGRSNVCCSSRRPHSSDPKEPVDWLRSSVRRQRHILRVPHLRSSRSWPPAVGQALSLVRMQAPFDAVIGTNSSPVMSASKLIGWLKTWWSKLRPRPLSELLAVELDERGVRVVVLDRLEPNWNQQFVWLDSLTDPSLY